MLEITGLTKRFGGFVAVRNVSFEVRRGEILGLIGPNGSGKSTTLNLIAGAMKCTAGSIRLEGTEITGLPAHRICHRGVGRTFQIPKPIRRLSVLDNVTVAAYYGPGETMDRTEARERAAAVLAMVGLPHDGDTMTQGFGAAALKKLELAKALAVQPRLLLADESLGGLDHTEMESASNLLNRIRREHGITIVWVEHIMGVLMRVVDRVVVLDHGETIFSGLPAEAARDTRVVEVYLGHRAARNSA